MENFSKLDSNVCIEPKLTNRFVVEFNESELNVASWMAQTITMPKFQKDKWENIIITFIDAIQQSSSESLCKLVERIQKTNKSDINFTIKILDPIGKTVEVWNISADVDNVDFGKLSYDSSELRMLSLTVSPKICYYENRCK